MARLTRLAGTVLLVVALVPPGLAAGPTPRPDIPALVDAYARRYGIPPALARNLVRLESGGRPDAVSPNGARGVMQLMPSTARMLGIDIDDPEQNIEGGMRYLRMQYDRFGRWDLAVAAYHAGPAAVERHGGVPPSSAAFVQQVMHGTPAAASGTSVRPAARTSSAASSSTARLPSGFAWPLTGPLTARFTRSHRGVDIAAPVGTPIRASRAGRAVHAGRYYDYGLTVILDHGGGVTTLYGHTSALHVRVGQAVRAGQVIARVGCTGRCTGPHVHFEIRINGRAVDPLRELPAMAQRPASRPAPAAGPEVLTAAPPPAPEGAGPLPPGIVVAADYDATVRDTVQDGRIVRRVEEIVVRLEDGTRIRIVREYRLVGGLLVLVSERSEVYREDQGRREP